MMSCLSWMSRIVARALVSGLQTSLGGRVLLSEAFWGRALSSGVAQCAGASESVQRKAPLAEEKVNPLQLCRPLQYRSRDPGPGFVSVVSGLPKDFSSSTFRRGQFGDDAWFMAGNATADVIGVADGVGGWRSHGVDPGEFSFSLMQACERLVNMGFFTPTKPESILAAGFSQVCEKSHVQGSSTACLLVLNREDAVLHCANLGDSGFVVVRNGKVVHRSEEQTHSFNTPFQLSCPPPGERVLCDKPEAASISHLPVQDGDVILLATDGLFDNLPEHVLVSELSHVEGVKDHLRLQTSANAIALMARTLAFDSKFMSPFARSAQLNGINAIGGKPDDITVLLATVEMNKRGL